MLDQFALRPFGKHWHHGAQEQIAKNIDVSLYCCTGNTTFSGNGADRHLRSVGKRNRLHKAGKRPEIPDQTLLLNFFTQIEIYIGR